METDTRHLPQKAAQTAIVVPQPLVSLQRGAHSAPQDLPNIMSHLKPSTNPSSLLALPNAGPSSKPSSTTPVDIDPQSQAHADLLAELGIKVRDFAYESKLPPVQPYRVRQTQPGPRPLKRSRRDGEEHDVFQGNITTQAVEGSSSKKSKLKREDTEPDVTQHQPRRARALGLFNIRDLDRDPDAPPWYQTPPQPTEYSQPNEVSQSQPLPLLDSQDSEPYILTPLVTPNGSLQWRDDATTNDVPASQLDTQSQANDPVLLSCSQLGMLASLESQPESIPEPEPDTTGTGLVGRLTPMSSLSSVTSDVLPTCHDMSTLSRSSTSPPSPNESSTPSPDKPTAPTPTSRYQLRRRPIHSPSPTRTGAHGRNAAYKASYPMPRPVAYTMQSSHSKAKASLGRVTRTREGTTGSRDETMIVR